MRLGQDGIGTSHTFLTHTLSASFRPSVFRSRAAATAGTWLRCLPLALALAFIGRLPTRAG